MTKLILHVGLGKTGTTAFQDAIRDSFDILKEAGFLCAGPRLRFAVPTEDELEAQFHAGEPEYLASALNALERAAANSPELSTVIWSNETIGMAPDLIAVVGVIERFIDQTKIFDEVEIAICFRRQDEWAESAYRQWGLKHKMIEARGIETPEAWLERSWDALDYLGQYRIWAALGADRIRVMTYDAMRDAGGSVPYLCSEFGIPVDLLPSEAMGKSNVSLGPAQSHLNALFNASYDESVRPVEFARVLNEYELPELDTANSAFISKKLRQTILDRCQADNDTLAREALGRVYLFEDRPIGGQVVYTNGTQDALILLSRIVAKQHQSLTDKQKQLDDKQRQLDDKQKQLHNNQKQLHDNQKQLHDNQKQLDDNQKQLDDKQHQINRLSGRLTYEAEHLANVAARLRDMEKPGYWFRKINRRLKAKFGRGS